jgi:peptide/nickel transport system substrate-binding protein
MQLKKPAIAIAMAAVLTLAACGGDGDNDSDGDGPAFQEGGQAGSGKNAELEGPKEVPEDAAEGGTLTVLTDEGPATFDPTRAYYTDSTAILDLVTRALTQYVYDPETEDMILAPDLATDLGRPNEDNTEWTFTIREGIKYEDGSDVTAEDVAYAVKRSFAQEELPDGPVYQNQFFVDGDTYKGPYQDGTDYAGVEVDGQDVTIKMARSFPEMDYYASFPIFTPIPEAKDTGEEYGNHPLATGPYKFEDYRPGTSLTLVRNDQWDPETDPGRIQTVDQWEFKFAQDTARLENVIVDDRGTAQTTFSYDDVTPATLRKIQTEGPERLTTGTSPCTYLWYLDQRKITDIKIRQAIGHAFPYEAYWNGIKEIVGTTRQPGTTILPPGTAGKQEFDPLGNGGTQTDPEAARALLEEADAVGYEIKWFFSSDDPDAVAGKDAIVEGLEAAGFKATPVASTSATIRDELNDPAADVNVRSQGWCSDWPSGGSWFPAQWIGSLITEDSVSNPSFLDDPAVNEEVNRILDDAEAEEAPDLWGELDQTIMEDIYPAVNLGYSGTAVIRGSKVGNFNNDTIRGMPTLKDLYIIE